LPLTIGLIVDVSGSQRKFVEEHKRTMAQFLAQVLRPTDQGFLVAVSGDVKLVVDLTHSVGDLSKGVELLSTFPLVGKQLGEPCPTRRVQIRGRDVQISRCGGTALWNGVYSSAKLKMKSVDGRKALIVLTDGWDTGSTHTLADAIEAAESADTLVYTIRYSMLPTVLVPGPNLKSRSMLRRISNETGGREYGSPKEGPGEIFAQIETELRNLYVLGFTVPESARDGKFHKLEVKSKRTGVTARSRSGYMAIP
jgi:Ca-activated chloride channel family protein